MANMLEEIQTKLKNETVKYKLAQRDYCIAFNQKREVEGQLNENIVVQKELDLLKSEDVVFKLVGPVLIKQDLEEAKQNVSKRLEFISSEMKRVEDLITASGEKADKHRENIEKYEQMFEQALMKAALNQPKK
ncbi:prefoldin 6 [Nomia melanderi]|uniref:prefoldin 6 n=1 Tax=Nomia melanderi TaxID=2448451 RepID=UPI001304794E|nr:prefoldin subunit 6 [Nomia melanderi]